MSFRIHSTSLELKRDLERKLAELDGQFDENFEYEISAETLPRGQALDRAQELAQNVGAESIFVSENVFAVEKPQEEDPDFAMGLPTVTDATGSDQCWFCCRARETIRIDSRT